MGLKWSEVAKNGQNKCQDLIFFSQIVAKLANKSVSHKKTQDFPLWWPRERVGKLDESMVKKCFCVRF